MTAVAGSALWQVQGTSHVLHLFVLSCRERAAGFLCGDCSLNWGRDEVNFAVIIVVLKYISAFSFSIC